MEPFQRRSDGVLHGTAPVKIAIDASSDGLRATYVALVVTYDEKPRLIYGTGTHVAHADVEWWGIKRAIRRVNTRFHGQRPILVFTDNLAIVNSRGSVHVQYRWLPRTDRLMQHIDRAAKCLRRSLP